MTGLKYRLTAFENSFSDQDRVATQVALSGKPRPIGTLPLRATFNALFKTDIIEESIVNTKNEWAGDTLFAALKEAGWEVIYDTNHRIIEEEKTKTYEVVMAKENECMLQFVFQYRSLFENTSKRYRDTDQILDVDLGEVDFVSSLNLFTGPHADKSQEFLDLIELSKKHVREKHTGAEIGIVSISDSEYYVKNFSLEGKTPAFAHPDLHYGDGFLEFHTKMLKRLETTTKGLVLLHGDPGTGKTQYIRVLLKELSKVHKSILYAPPSLSASLTDPAMIEFISDWVLGEERDCILLIEDAEPLLEVRGGSDGRSLGISNLLNMTDGLLNDILGLTVIATFNTPLAKIDPALLRPQRLVARKEFRKLPKEQFVKLSEALEMELPDMQFPATLAEFYASKNNNEVLIHEVRQESTIGFRR